MRRACGADATDTEYTCEQAPIQGKCDGPYTASFLIEFVAPPDFEFLIPGGCDIAGPVATCEATVPADDVLLFNFPFSAGNLPGEQIVVDNIAIEGIRATHFPPVTDLGKSVFNGDLTDGDLGHLFFTGWSDLSVG
jgi:hypothetical protein